TAEAAPKPKPKPKPKPEPKEEPETTVAEPAPAEEPEEEPSESSDDGSSDSPGTSDEGPADSGDGKSKGDIVDLGFRGVEVPDGSKDEQAIAIAKQDVGTPYVSGGTSPRGWDC